MLYLRRKKSLKIASYFKPSQWTDPLNIARLKNCWYTSVSSLWMKAIVISMKPVPCIFTMNATIRWFVHMCALRAPIVSWIGLGTFTVTQLDSFIGIRRVINSEIIWWRQTTAVWIPRKITWRLFAVFVMLVKVHCWNIRKVAGSICVQ